MEGAKYQLCLWSDTFFVRWLLLCYICNLTLRDQTSSCCPIFLRSYVRVEMNKLYICKITVNTRRDCATRGPRLRRSLARAPQSSYQLPAKIRRRKRLLAVYCVIGVCNLQGARLRLIRRKRRGNQTAFFPTRVHGYPRHSSL